MSAAKEIRSKIKSVQNTQKITRAMQMVATSKMRKTQERMRAARPYAENIRRVMANLAGINNYAKNNSPYLRSCSNPKSVGIIVITSDKGLCGGLNANVLKLFYENVKKFKNSKVSVEVCPLGQKGLNASLRVGLDVTSSAVSLGDVPQMEKLIGPISNFLTKFHNQQLDAVYVVYSHFVNTMKQQPKFEQLLPLSKKDLQQDKVHFNDYEYEPSALEVLDQIISRYVESVVFQCLADNMASEQAARMVAMKSATDNAGLAINELRLVYNKSRQASITKELAEIVAGSAAV
ncbi:MAG: F0F1 ATP synthase subunit gamma [Burkholderiales bacterium]|jgi:F-type H+-transporting ATPase subunit gamma|nr:F0F1 ATP synthase subunit gamma [Burkholderiales bacterium]